MAQAITSIMAVASEPRTHDPRGVYPAVRQVRHRQNVRQMANALKRTHGSVVERKGQAPADVPRSHDRASLLLVADVRVARAPAQKAVVRNISAAGLMVEMDGSPFRGDFVSLNLGNLGWTDGTVAWRVGRRFGVRFDKEIDPANVRRPIGALPRMHQPAPLRRVV